MNWRNTLLKEWGDRHKKDDGSEFIEGVGFKQKDFSKDKSKSGDLVNWFKSVQQTFDSMLDSIGFSTESLTDPSGTSSIRRDKSNSAKVISKYGQDIARMNIDSMLEGYVKSITKDAAFNDDITNIQSIMSQSGYSRTIDAALKFTEELLSSIFDSCYRSVKMINDDGAPASEEEEIKLDVRGDVPNEYIEQAWGRIEQNVTKDLDNMLNGLDGILEDIIVEDSKVGDLDLDNDGTQDVTLEEVKGSIKTNLKKLYSGPNIKNMLKIFSGNVSFSFQVKYPLQQQQMEANEEVADQVTEEDAEEMRNRPEIQARELNEEEREEFEDEYKSNDTYRNEYGWQSILSKQYGTGMTSMAGFSPAIHNITHGSKEEPCCDECEDKTTSCGCE
tara:strand:+ start:4957 stop:6120 length:1164 start_codon:yes stop_codon:yes gene_type:complete